MRLLHERRIPRMFATAECGHCLLIRLAHMRNFKGVKKLVCRILGRILTEHLFNLKERGIGYSLCSMRGFSDTRVLLRYPLRKRRRGIGRNDGGEHLGAHLFVRARRGDDLDRRSRILSWRLSRRLPKRSPHGLV